MDLLISMIEQSDEPGPAFLQHCQGATPGPALGGKEISDTITAVFAALLWHTQQLRDDTEKYGKDRIIYTLKLVYIKTTLRLGTNKIWSLYTGGLYRQVQWHGKYIPGCLSV